jgi:AAA15 family ATPase/GTPase
LKEFDIEDVPDMVVLAGPNGVGKSSVLQAIAYLKEVIAPYPPYSLPPVVSRCQSKEVKILGFRIFSLRNYQERCIMN